jgi:hypothetical protein
MGKEKRLKIMSIVDLYKNTIAEQAIKITALEEKVEELENEIRALEVSKSIPREYSRLQRTFNPNDFDVNKLREYPE